LPQASTHQRWKRGPGLSGGKYTMKDQQDTESRGTPLKSYDETFKRNAVDLSLRGGRTVKQVAEQLGLPEWALYRWRRKYAPRPVGPFVPVKQLPPEEKDEEIRRLRAEVIRMREREIVLKKSLGILSETPGSGMPKWTR
jgi:transposase